MEYLQELLRTEPKSEDAFIKLQIKYKEVVREKERYRTKLDLLEQATRHVYDSIMITTSAVYTAASEIIYVNDAFSKMTGFSKEEVIGQSPHILQGSNTDSAVLNKQNERMQKGQSFSGQTVNYRKDKTEFTIQWDVHPLANDEGKITHWVSYQHDITERRYTDKGMEFAQEETEKMIADMDTDGNLTGLRSKELETKNIRDFIPAKHAGLFKSKFRQLQTDRSASSPLHFEMTVKDENLIEVSVVFCFIPANGQQYLRATFENCSLHKRIKSLSELQIKALGKALDPDIDSQPSRN